MQVFFIKNFFFLYVLAFSYKYFSVYNFNLALQTLVNRNKPFSFNFLRYKPKKSDLNTPNPIINMKLNTLETFLSL